jgi:hypothetical protein
MLMNILMIIISIGLFVIIFVAWAKIFAKAGYASWHWIYMIIPVVNVVWFFVFAFSKWPILLSGKLQNDSASSVPPVSQPNIQS